MKAGRGGLRVVIRLSYIFNKGTVSRFSRYIYLMDLDDGTNYWNRIKVLKKALIRNSNSVFHINEISLRNEGIVNITKR